MTGKSNNYHEKLERLAAALIEDILSATDQEVLDDAREHYGDPRAAADTVRAIFQQAKLKAGKAKLETARRDLDSQRANATRAAMSLDMAKARQLVAKYAANDSDVHGRLTMAARKAEELSDQDIRGIIDDMIELGIISVDGNEFE